MFHASWVYGINISITKDKQIILLRYDHCDMENKLIFELATKLYLGFDHAVTRFSGGQ